jgi:hypothetical protein
MAEIVDVLGPKEALPGTVVNVKTIVQNTGDSPGYFGVSASHTDGTQSRATVASPTRVRLRPGAIATFLVIFPMPNHDTAFLVRVWHDDPQHPVGSEPKGIAIKCAVGLDQNGEDVQEACVGSVQPEARQRQQAILHELRQVVDQRARIEAEMSSQPDVQQRQRAIVRGYRRAVDERAQAEAEASSLLQKKKSQADKELDQFLGDAARSVGEARVMVNRAESALSEVGLKAQSVKSRPTGSAKWTGTDPAREAQELSRLSATAVQAGNDIVTTVNALKNWRLAEREKSQLNTALVLLLLSCSGLVLFLAGVTSSASGLTLPSLVAPPLLLALADMVWDLGNKRPGSGFNGNYLWLWLVAPLAPFVALYYVVVRYPDSSAAIDSRYSPMQSQDAAVRCVSTLAPNLLQTVASMESSYSRLVDKANQHHLSQLKRFDREHDQRVAEIRSSFRVAWERLRNESLALHRSLGLAGATWDSDLWNAWSPPERRVLSPCLRIGQLTDKSQWHEFVTPALVPILGEGNLVIKCSGAARDQALGILRGVMLRLLTTVPPGKLRFILIDPIGLGQSMAAFMSLADHDETLVEGRIWTEPRHIEEQLARITEHMEFVIQQYLRDKYPTIENYNAEAEEVAEPYRVVVVANFPAGFSESAARRLASIAVNGPRCGVYTLVTIDAEQHVSYRWD